MSLDEEEYKKLEKLKASLDYARVRNTNKYNYVNQELYVKDLGIATPEKLKGLNVVVGWAGIAVDTLLERTRWEGWWSPEADDSSSSSVDFLNNIYKDNFLEIEQDTFMKDSYITGTSYISVGVGDTEKGEPEIIWRAENPNSCFGEYNLRNFKLNNFVKFTNKDKQGEFYTQNSIIFFEIINNKFVEKDRYEHNLGFVPVVPIINQRDSLHPRGKSELSRALRYYIDSAMRTLLAAEVTRDAYSRPFRYLSGMDQEMIQDPSGNPLSYWDMVAGGIANIPYNSRDGIVPTLSQLAPSSPAGVLEILEPIAKLAATEIGIPVSDLGMDTVNPSSADALNEVNKKQIAKANARIPVFKKALKQAAEISFKLAGREIPENFREIEAVFRRPETPTPAATADMMSKYVAAGVFSSEYPTFVYRSMGFTEQEIRQLQNFMKANASASLVQQLIDSTSTTEFTASAGVQTPASPPEG